MALTATASLSTRKSVIKSLSMQKPVIIYLAPVRDNIIFIVANKPESIPLAFKPFIDRLIEDRYMGRVEPMKM